MWAGEVTNDAFAPLRAPRLTPPRRGRSSARADAPAGGASAPAARGAQPQVQGRWSLTEPPVRAGDGDPAERRRTQAELLLERYGIVTREQVLAEGIPGGFSSLYDALGRARDARRLPAAATSSRASAARSSRCPARSSGCARQRDDDEAPPLVLAATDPAQPYGAALPWPKRDDGAAAGPQRVAGAYVVLAGAEPVLYVERGGKGLRSLVDRRRPAHRARARGARRRRPPRPHPQARARARRRRAGGRLAWEAPLIELGFRAGPRKLTLTA